MEINRDYTTINNINIVLKVGDTFRSKLYVVESYNGLTSTPIDLTDWLIEAQIRIVSDNINVIHEFESYIPDSTPLSSEILISGENLNKIQLAIPYLDAEKFKHNEYVYDIQITKGIERYTIAGGCCTINQDVTR
jgi:hypothetical protein